MYFPDIPCIKGFTETHRRRYTGQQPRTKSARAPADQRPVNRWSTARQTLISFLHRCTQDFVCLCFRTNVQKSVIDSLEGKREGCPLAGLSRWRPVLQSPAPPSCPAVLRPDPTSRSLSGSWIRQVRIFFHLLGILREPANMKIFSPWVTMGSPAIYNFSIQIDLCNAKFPIAFGPCETCDAK